MFFRTLALVLIVVISACSNGNNNNLHNELDHITVEPAISGVLVGDIERYTAIGTFKDGHQEDISSQVNWDSRNTAVVKVNNKGFVEGLSTGGSVIIASQGDISAAAVIAVFDPGTSFDLVVIPADATQPAGTNKQYTALAYLGSRGVVDVTGRVSWSSSDDAVLAVDINGLVDFITPGTANISASYREVTRTVPATVTRATLTELRVNPLQTSISSGVQVQYQAVGIYSDSTVTDVTGLVVWSSDNNAVASVDASGLASTASTGNAVITASFSGLSAAAQLQVTAATLTDLQILPPSISAPAGTSGQLRLLARYTDGRVEEVASQAVWRSANLAIAIVQTSGQQAGFSQLIAPGLTTFTAQFGGLESAAQIEVSNPVLERIQLNPINRSVASGVDVQYQATGIYSDDSQQPLDDEVSWQSSDTNIAVMNTDGLANTLMAGDTVISAFYLGVYSETPLTVTVAVVTEIAVLPGTVSGPAGTFTKLRAVALYSDSSVQDVTSQSSWVSADPDTAYVAGTGPIAGFTALRSEGLTQVTASFSGFINTVSVEVTPAVLSEIVISPVDQSVPQGINVQYSATGLYTDSSSSSLDDEVSWFSSDPSVAVITPEGLALTNEDDLTRGVGSTVISASFAGLSDETGLTVTNPQIVSLQITPANLTEPAGTRGRLTATALYTDNRTIDVTDQALWSSSDEAVASVVTGGSDAGLAYLLSEGNAQISAQLDGVGDTIDVQVTAALLIRIQVDPVLQNIPVGLESQYRATGFFSDGSSSSIDEDVSWQSSNSQVATIDLDGLVSAQKVGAAFIIASLDGINGLAGVLVTGAQVIDIQITPPSLTKPAGTSGQLLAMASLSDGTTRDITTESTWISSDPTVVVVQTTGAQGGFTELIAKGQAVVSANYDGVSKSISVMVTDAVLVDILIDPVNFSITEGVDLQYSATGVFSDGSTSPINDDVSWVSTATAVATINATGIATGVAPGTCKIRAYLGEIASEVDLTVTAATITAIQVSPAINTLSVGQSDQYQAIAVYNNSLTDDVTDVATWSTTDSNVAVISNASINIFRGVGVLSATGEGTANALATFQGVTGSADVTVEGAVLSTVKIIPSTTTLPKGVSTQWTAVASFSNNSELDITADANWSSDNTAVAAVILGELIGVDEGSASISINYQGLGDNQSVTVIDPVVFSVEVTPSFSVMDLDTTQQLIAVASYSDGSNVIVTNDVSWGSNDPLIAQISNADGRKGAATALSVGTVDISTDLNGQLFQNIAAIEVKDLVLTGLEITPTAIATTRESNVFFKAQGVYNDGSKEDVTQEVTWESSDDKVAAIGNSADDKGVATTRKIDGSVTITATSPNDGNIFATATLDVNGDCGNGPPTDVTAGPVPASVSVGGSLQLNLTADFSGCERNVTRQPSNNWNSLNNQNVATVDKAGLVTGLSLGTSDIQGKYKGVADVVTVSVIAAEVARVEIAPTGPLLVDVLASINLTCAMQQVSGGDLQPEENITDLAAWEVQDSAVAGLGANSAAAQVVDGIAIGSTVVRCSYGGQSASVTVVVQ